MGEKKIGRSKVKKAKKSQLVSSSVRSKQLLSFVQGQGQKTEQKHTAKNFDEFQNHSPLLTMVILGIKQSTDSAFACRILGYFQSVISTMG